MDEFLKRYKLLKLTQEEIITGNRPITSRDWAIYQTILKKKWQWVVDFTSELEKFKEKLTNFFYKLFQKNKKGQNTFQLILRGKHYPNIKTRQRHHKEIRHHTNVTYEYRPKNLQQAISKLNPKIYKKFKHYDQVRFISEIQGLFNLQKSINVI